jgi:hypothetical protein
MELCNAWLPDAEPRLKNRPLRILHQHRGKLFQLACGCDGTRLVRLEFWSAAAAVCADLRVVAFCRWLRIETAYSTGIQLVHLHCSISATASPWVYSARGDGMLRRPPVRRSLTHWLISVLIETNALPLCMMWMSIESYQWRGKENASCVSQRKILFIIKR